MAVPDQQQPQQPTNVQRIVKAAAAGQAAQMAGQAAAGGVIGPGVAVGAPPAKTATAAVELVWTAAKWALILKLLRRLFAKHRAESADWLTAQLLKRFPGVDPVLVRQVVERELEFEKAFQRNAEKRVQAAHAAAGALATPEQQAAKLKAAMSKEAQYAALRQQAMLARAHGALEVDAVKKRSPAGAIWTLGQRKTHTPGCIALAGKAWPWSVLDVLFPPLHPNCGCSLRPLGPHDPAPPPAGEAMRMARAAAALDEAIRAVADPGEIDAYLAGEPIRPSIERALEEFTYKEALHPRGRGGRWIEKLGNWPSAHDWQHSGREDISLARAADFASAAFSSDLSDEERKFVQNYVGTGYIQLNEGLRHHAPLSEYRQRQMEALDSAIGKSTVHADVTVYRGYSRVGNPFRGVSPGDEFVDDGYSSTSLRTSVPSQYYGTVAEIRLPAGSHALSLDQAGVSDISESEVLLPRGMHWRVAEVHGDGVPSRVVLEPAESLQEAQWEEYLHPRGRRGQWIKALNHFKAPRPAAAVVAHEALSGEDLAQALDGFEHGGITAVRSPRTETQNQYARVWLNLERAGESVGQATVVLKPPRTRLGSSERTAELESIALTQAEQNHGFGRAFTDHLFDTLRDGGVNRVELDAVGVGGYSWARRGFVWTEDKQAEQHAVLDEAKETGRWDQTIAHMAPEDAAELERKLEAGEFSSEAELAAYGVENAWDSGGPGRRTWAGKELMLGSFWHGERQLASQSPPLQEAHYIESQHLRNRLGRWIDMPGIHFNPALPGEARNERETKGYISIGPKFAELSQQQQEHVIAHEVGHDLADDLIHDTEGWWWNEDEWKDKDGVPLGGPGYPPTERISDAYAALISNSTADIERWPAISRIADEARKRGFPMDPAQPGEPESPPPHEYQEEPWQRDWSRAAVDSATRFAEGSFQDEPLTVREGKALQDYEVNGYKKVNRLLRKPGATFNLDRNENAWDQPRANQTATIGEIMDGLDGAIAKSVTTKDMTVFRGMDFTGFLGLTGRGASVGDEVIDPGYGSTSLRQRVALGSERSAQVEIHIPAGTHALSYDKSDHPVVEESEVLMPRGTHYRIVSIGRNEQGADLVVLEVVPPTANGPELA